MGRTLRPSFTLGIAIWKYVTFLFRPVWSCWPRICERSRVLQLLFTHCRIYHWHVSTHVLWTQECSKVWNVVREHSDTLVQLLWQDEKAIYLSKHVCCPESRANDKTFHEHGLTLMSVNCNCWFWLFNGCLISYEMYPTTPGLLKVMVCKQHKPTLHQSPVQWARTTQPFRRSRRIA